MHEKLFLKCFRTLGNKLPKIWLTIFLHVKKRFYRSYVQILLVVIFSNIKLEITVHSTAKYNFSTVLAISL